MSKKDLSKLFNNKNLILYFGLFFGISGIAFYYINKIYSKGSNLERIFDFPTSIITALLLVLFFYYIFDGLRLYFVLKTLEAEISFWKIYKLVFINIFVSNITPLATGGGFAQAYFLQKQGIPLGKSSAAVVIRTLLSAAMLFLSVPLIIFRNQKMLNLLPADYLFVYLIFFLAIYFFVFYLLIFKNRVIMKYTYKFFYFLKSKHLITKKRFKKIVKYIFKHLEIFADDLSSFIQGKKIYVFLSFFFTLIFLGAEFSFSYLILKGLGYNIMFIHILSLQILVVFIMYFAPTPGAAGIAEGGYSLLFARFVDKSDLFPLLFYWRFFSKYIGIFIGILVFVSIILKGGAADAE